MSRYAVIDIGTNSVLLLVADRGATGRFVPVVERAEITRLGRGVDRAKTLSVAGMEETLLCLERFVEEAKSLGVEGIAATATSAARDATNGADFLAQARKRAGLEVEIISGELEAELSFGAVRVDFAERLQGRQLIVLDIGGGSTEFIYGAALARSPDFKRTFDVGSVRLTERLVTRHPIPADEQDRVRVHLEKVFASLPAPPAGAQLVGVAGTVTTLLCLHERIEPYDAQRVQGARLTLDDVRALAAKLASLPVEERRKLPGLDPKRADVIAVGALVLEAAMNAVHAPDVWVSDRGLRWGFLQHRFGA